MDLHVLHDRDGKITALSAVAIGFHAVPKPSRLSEIAVAVTLPDVEPRHLHQKLYLLGASHKVAGKAPTAQFVRVAAASMDDTRTKRKNQRRAK